MRETSELLIQKIGKEGSDNCLVRYNECCFLHPLQFNDGRLRK